MHPENLTTTFAEHDHYDGLGTVVDGYLIPTDSMRTPSGVTIADRSGPGSLFFITPEQGASRDGYWAPSGARRQPYPGTPRPLAPATERAYVALLERHGQRLGDDMVRQIANYTPTSLAPSDWATIAWYVKEVVSATADPKHKDPISHVNAVAQYVHYWHNLHGLPLDDSKALWTVPLVIAYTERALSDRPERYVANVRSRLMGVANKVNPRVVVSVPTKRRAVVGNAPYSQQELERFQFIFSTLDTVYKRRNCMLTLVLSAGAGLNPSDYVLLKNKHIIKDPDGPGTGFDIDVPAAWGQSRTSLNARRVPLLTQWETLMYELWDGDIDPEEYVTWPNVHDTRTNLAALGNGIRNAIRQADQRPKIHRLRTTWTVHHLQQGTPMQVLRIASGLNSSESLYRYMQYLEQPDWSTTRRILRGEQ